MDKNKKKTKRVSSKKILKWFWALFVGGILIAALLFVLIAKGFVGYMPPIEDLENPIDKYASQVISVDLKPLGTYAHSKENRIYVSYQDLSPHIIHALIATEDARFVDHSGIDAYALARAIIKRGILMQKSGGGGSTISQQLAKLLYSPSVGSLSERLLQKPIEWVIAVKLEKYYTKEEIVSMYLNKFDFLYNAVGIKSASWVYFGKEPKDLLVEEAATLVGMCKNPSYYNPIRKIERTKGRRDVVLNLMYKNKFISQTQKDSLQQIPLTTNFNRVDHKDGLAPYFREYLRLMMTAQKPNSEHYSTWQKYKFAEDSLAWETNPVYGWCNKNTKSNGQPYNIYTDGLKIYTNIDSRMQTYAEESVKEHIGDYLQDIFFKEKSGRDYAPFSKSLKKTDMEAILERSMKQTKRYEDLKKENYSDIEISKIFNNEVEMTVFSWKGLRDTTMTPMDSIRYMKSFLRAGFAAMDPKTGAVKAYVGGIDYKYFQYDMVNMGRRQIGSTIKPYLYALAMEEGFTPCDEVLHVEQELVDENGRLYIPRNANKKNVGEMVSIKWGLQNSDNWVTAYLMKQLSPYVLARLLHSFGLQGQIDPVVSLCLGPCDASVGEMVSAYSAFANGGVRAQMSCVSRIEDGMGNVLATFTPQSSEVLSEEATYKTLHMLRAVVDGGTGGRIRRYGISAPMGGKTGTSQNNSDGWFMGFTPSLVGGVWVGGEDRSIHFDRMAEGQAAAMALPIFGIFMKKVYADKSLGYSQTENFEVPYIYANPCAGGSEMRDLSTPKLEDEIFE